MQEKGKLNKFKLIIVLLILLIIAVFLTSTYFVNKQNDSLQSKNKSEETKISENTKNVADKLKKDNNLEEKKTEENKKEVIQTGIQEEVKQIAKTEGIKKESKNKVNKEIKPKSNKNNVNKKEEKKPENKPKKKEEKPKVPENNIEENTNPSNPGNSNENNPNENNSNNGNNENGGNTQTKKKIQITLTNKKILKGEPLSLEDLKTCITLLENAEYVLKEEEQSLTNLNTLNSGEFNVKVKVDFNDENIEDEIIQITIEISDKNIFKVNYVLLDNTFVKDEIIEGVIGEKLNIAENFTISSKPKAKYVVKEYDSRPIITNEKNKVYTITVNEIIEAMTLKPGKVKKFDKGEAELTEYEKDGKKIYTLWVKGIKPPKQEDFVIEQHQDYETPLLPFKMGEKWYDTNKNKGVNEHNISDQLLCSGAVSANLLHWWLEQNKENVEKYLQKNPEKAFLDNSGSQWKNLRTYIDSFKSQEESKIFDMYKYYFGNGTTTLWSDSSIDLFINGYKPSNTGATNIPERYQKDPRGGFFYDVFGKEILTDRMYAGSNLKTFGDMIRRNLKKGYAMGITHEINSLVYDHIITVWGADFDIDGNILGIYISDSDDQYQINSGMKRYKVQSKNGKVVVTTSKKSNVGSEVIYLYTLKLGTEKWEEYFSKTDKKIETTTSDIITKNFVNDFNNMIKEILNNK